MTQIISLWSMASHYFYPAAAAFFSAMGSVLWRSILQVLLLPDSILLPISAGNRCSYNLVSSSFLYVYLSFTNLLAVYEQVPFQTFCILLFHRQYFRQYYFFLCLLSILSALSLMQEFPMVWLSQVLMRRFLNQFLDMISMITTIMMIDCNGNSNIMLLRMKSKPPLCFQIIWVGWLNAQGKEVKALFANPDFDVFSSLPSLLNICIIFAACF